MTLRDRNWAFQLIGDLLDYIGSKQGTAKMTSYLVYWLVYFILPLFFTITIPVGVGVVGCCCLTPDKMVRIVFPYIKKDGKHITIFGFIAKTQFVQERFYMMLLVVGTITYVVLTNAFLTVSYKYNPYDDLECFFTNHSRVEQLSPDEAINLEEEVRCFAWKIDIGGAVGRATGTLVFSWIIVSIVMWLTLQLGHIFKEKLKNTRSKTDKMVKICSRVLLIAIQFTIYVGTFLIIALAIASLVFTWIPYYSYLEIGLFTIILSSGIIQRGLVMKQPENMKDYCGELVQSIDQQPGQTLELIEAFKKMTREHLSDLDRTIPKVGAANAREEQPKETESSDTEIDTDTENESSDAETDTENESSDAETEGTYIETESNDIGSDKSSDIEIDDGGNNDQAQEDERGGNKGKEINNHGDRTPDQTPEEKYKKDKATLEEIEEQYEQNSKENDNYFKKVLKTVISIENRTFKLREKKFELDDKECKRQNYLNKSERKMGTEEDGSIIDEATLKKERRKNDKKSKRLTRKTKRWQRKCIQHQIQTLDTMRLFNHILKERLRLRKVRKKLRSCVEGVEVIKLEREKIALEQTELNVIEEKHRLLRIKLLREMAVSECKKALASEAAFYVTKEEMNTITTAAFAKVLLKYMFDDEEELSASTKTTSEEHPKLPRKGYAGIEELKES